MTQVFDDAGLVHPATVVRVPNIVVTQVKTKEKDGYEAVQVGMGVRKPSRVSKAVIGHLRGKGPFESIKEFRIDAPSQKEGDSLSLEQFKIGDNVKVTAISKAKGFQGVVKRHGFAGGPRTHGQKHSEREPGSIGGGLRNKVPKKMRMAGRMGGDRITVSNLKVVALDNENSLVYIKGAIPGRRGTLVEIIGK